MPTNLMKRGREVRDVDTKMVEIYEDLANESPKIRLSATRLLLSRFREPAPFDAEQYKTIITRLVRGLCSGRKAARIGFSVALTELLSQRLKNDVLRQNLAEKDLLDIIERQTVSQGNVSGQDERDHLFGRLFALDAVVESGTVLRAPNSLNLCLLLFQLILGLTAKKVWLRQECGYLLFKFIQSTGSDHIKQAETLLQQLTTQKIIRTPEGLAIWLLVREKHPTANFPKNVWRHDDPLHQKEKELLAKVMRDATPKDSQETKEQTAEGAGLWSPQLHFAWAVVLRNFERANETMDETQRLEFSAFWEETVDHGLLHPSSSTERKHWALLVTRKVIQESSFEMASSIFSTEVISCLKNQLASPSRTLHSNAKKVCEALRARVREEPDFAALAVTSLLGPLGNIDFDQVTKTKTVEGMISSASAAGIHYIQQFLQDMFITQPDLDPKASERKRRSIADWLTLIFTRQSPELLSDDSGISSSDIAHFMVRYAYFVPNQASTKGKSPSPPLAENTRTHLQLRLFKCLEHNFQNVETALKCLYDVMKFFWDLIQQPDNELEVLAQLDDDLRNTVDASCAMFRSIAFSNDSSDRSNKAHGVLYGIALLQVYGGDADAISILTDLNEARIARRHGMGGKEYTVSEETDSTTETLLSFVSKPSKFLRRAGLLVFEFTVPVIGQQALDSLFKILCAKENIEGQSDLFDVEDVLQEIGTSDSEDDVSLAPDLEMLDQDTDAVSTFSGYSSHINSSKILPSTAKDGDGSSDNASDPELAAFDAKLATALGTHRGDRDLDASSSSPDQDMSDSEMEALDAQLSAVFAARREASKSKKSKQEHKFARENIVNFKNRVLDLLEVFFRMQKDNPLALANLAPTLSAARLTKTKQIADRLYQILRTFNDRCKGKSHIPPCPDPAATLSHLHAIHEEVQKGTSHAHAIACGNASVLIVRVLSHYHYQEIIHHVVDLYAESTKGFLLQGRILPGFFNAWNNWYVQPRGRLEEAVKTTTVTVEEKGGKNKEATKPKKQGSEVQREIDGGGDQEPEKTAAFKSKKQKRNKRKNRGKK